MAAAVLLLSLAPVSFAAELKPATTAAFDKYVAATEERMSPELRPGGPFLYVDALPPDERREAYSHLKQGEILVDKRKTRAPGVSSHVPDGMVHHWVGLVFIPGVTLAQTLRVAQDYDHRAELYKPEIIASRTLWHRGNDYRIFLRIYQKKFTTVAFNSEYDVHWGEVDPYRMFSNSISTKIAEVKDPDHPDGPELPVGQGHGYLWRLNTYWRFAQKDGGVYVQCEALSLTRDIPFGLAWLIKPLVKSIPKNTLNRTLGRTREVVARKAREMAARAGD
ncbi:MAG TPA: hypothetical protein VLT16_18250 [Candidatus Limnocylindrales bacterium]|nr:hypothetical protein [Candidatus Limnocylindrales bacterium]